MDNPRNLFRFLFVLTLAILAIIGLTWVNYRYVSQNPGGNDFLVHWVGTQTFITEGKSPYSDDVAQKIQTLAYGRPAQPGEHELRVAYPLYSVIFFAPFAIIRDFSLARALWMTTLELSLFFMAIICLRLTGWRPGIWLLLAYFLFIFLWYHSVRPLILGNAVILVTLLVSLALLSIRHERDELAGILLALATIKPQLMLLPCIFTILWAGFNGRWRIISSMLISLFFLVIGGVIFIPDWPLQNLREVLRYPAYNPPGTPGAFFREIMPGVGRQLGWALTGILTIVLVVEWWAARRQGFRWFLWTFCLTLIISQWIGIQTDPGNFILLFPGLVLVFSGWADRWGGIGKGFIVASMLGLGIGLWALFFASLKQGYQPIQNPIMFIPFPLYLLICLYWVRWWAIRPSRPLFDQLRSTPEVQYQID